MPEVAAEPAVITEAVQSLQVKPSCLPSMTRDLPDDFTTDTSMATSALVPQAGPTMSTPTAAMATVDVAGSAAACALPKERTERQPAPAAAAYDSISESR